MGEKLNEIFVRTELGQYSELQDRFWFVVPDANARPPRYRVISDPLLGFIETTQNALEEILLKAFHYRNARLLGHLSPIDLVQIPNSQELYFNVLMSRGIKWGDIKYESLIVNSKDALNFCQMTKCGLAQR